MPPPPSGSGFKITKLDPGSVIAGWSTIGLIVYGTGLGYQDTVIWNDNPLKTGYDSADGTLTGIVTSNLLTAPGKITITVSDGTHTSNSLTFQITPAAPGNIGVIQMITVTPDGSQQNGNSASPPAISANGRYVVFESNATNLVATPANNCTTPLVGGPCAQVYERDTCIGATASCQQKTILISAAMDGGVGNNSNGLPVVSADGRYVAFESIATNLVPNDTNPPADPDVFLRDTCIGAASSCTPSTIRISVGPNGEQADGASPSMNATGRYIVFSSNAPNIIAGGDPSYAEVYLRDTCIGATASCSPSTSMVSVSNTGQPDPNPAGTPYNSQNGRYIAFISDQFLSNDQHDGVYVRDTCIGAPSGCIPSTSNTYLTYNGIEANGPLAAGSQVSVSDDGRYSSFAADATTTNLVQGDTNNSDDVFVRDTCVNSSMACTPTTFRVSVASDGTQGNAGSLEGGMISPSGRLIVFFSIATNLVSNDTASGLGNIYVHDTCNSSLTGCSPSTVRVSVALDGYQGDGATVSPVISADDHWVTFLSKSTTLLMPQAIGGNWNVFLAKSGF